MYPPLKNCISVFCILTPVFFTNSPYKNLEDNKIIHTFVGETLNY